MNRIKLWRENTCLSCSEVARRLEIPLRTFQNWEHEVNRPAPWAENLLVEKLMQMADENIRERARKRMDKLKSDEDGKRPIGSWAVVRFSDDPYDDSEWIECFPTMQQAIEVADVATGKVDVAYLICNDTEKGPEPYYCDRKGHVETDYDYIKL